MSWIAPLLASVALIAPGSRECADLEAAHGALLTSSFSMERRFAVKMNGKLKVRETARFLYADGELTKETVEREVLDRSLVLDEGNELAALELPFSCERLARTEEGRYELSSADGGETVVFIRDRDRGALQPIAWRSTERTRFLFRKLVIEATAEYGSFDWR